MKIAYIAHPVGSFGAYTVNDHLNMIEDIVLKINRTEPDTVPFAPYYLDCIILDDRKPKDRERGIKNDIALIRAGFITEIRLYGSRISPGMLAEIRLATELNIPVIPMTKETKRGLELIAGSKML